MDDGDIEEYLVKEKGVYFVLLDMLEIEDDGEDFGGSSDEESEVGELLSLVVF